jgi:16S rRNA (cytosine967-C5)-methyltransferase
LYYFKEDKIDHYSNRQKKIAGNITPFVKPGGYLLYITCSVFKKENEEVVNFIKERSGFRLERMEFYKGYSLKADTMFAALFKAPAVGA